MGRICKQNIIKRRNLRQNAKIWHKNTSSNNEKSLGAPYLIFKSGPPKLVRRKIKYVLLQKIYPLNWQDAIKNKSCNHVLIKTLPIYGPSASLMLDSPKNWLKIYQGGAIGYTVACVFQHCHFKYQKISKKKRLQQITKINRKIRNIARHVGKVTENGASRQLQRLFCRL